MMKMILFVGWVLITYVGLAGEIVPNFSETIRLNQDKFKAEKTIVMLYDIGADKMVVMTPNTSGVKFQMGSLIKPVIVDEATKRNVVAWDSVIDCENGIMPVDGKMLRDVRPLGQLTVAECLLKKSNIGAYKIFMKVGLSEIDARLKLFGIHGNKNPYEYSTGLHVIATPEQVMRLYASLSTKTRTAMKNAYTATTVPDNYFETNKYFPCMLGFIDVKGKTHILFVGMLKSSQSPYYADIVAKPLWQDIAAGLQKETNQ